MLKQWTKPMRMPLTSRLLFTLAAVLMPIGAHLADMNETHMFNPLWPPHARFHNGQTLAFSLFLAAFTLFFAWRRTDDRETGVLAAAGFASVYWFTQTAAILYPGTTFFDPQFDQPSGYVLGVPIQLWIEFGFLAVIAAGTWVALRADAHWTGEEASGFAPLHR